MLYRVFPTTSVPAPGFTTWHDVSYPNPPHGSAIVEAFCRTAANDPSELSYGDRHDTRVFALNHEAIMDPGSELSKAAGYWYGTLDRILDEGWRVCYSNGTGRGLYRFFSTCQNFLLFPPEVVSAFSTFESACGRVLFRGFSQGPRVHFFLFLKSIG
ncbi:hypothetical protein L211DRAFT_838891 [Terfezia boudieri ATCC MYA-4762]|uniref:Uncharacterized protein n=1 Tax=Terfezia boudieri ATCC MYA-4762 TaxID=1051890 RepID=A0A3N4LZA2_9PEZI|nr:hypothetical protein L211DRAFT_838891 [Terfezia boudieri ATCC MYA-4762]